MIKPLIKKEIKCQEKAKGCKISFIPENKLHHVCSNPACKKKSVRKWFVKNLEKNMEYRKNINDYKDDLPQVIMVKRFCIGFYCRGEKERKMRKGKFMCARCTEYANTVYENV